MPCRILVPDQSQTHTPCIGIRLTRVSPFCSLPPLSPPPTLRPAPVGQVAFRGVGPQRSKSGGQLAEWSLVFPVRPWTSCVLVLSAPHPQHLKVKSGGRAHPSPGEDGEPTHGWSRMLESKSWAVATDPGIDSSCPAHAGTTPCEVRDLG